VERQHGSSEEARTQERRQERRAGPEQGGPQRIGEKGRSHACAEQGGAQGRAEAQVGRYDPNETEKPALSPAFLHLPA
jgi:hypothetical protein